MKTIKSFTFITCILLYCTSIYASGIKIKSGSLSALKTEKNINVKFDYSGVKMFNEISEQEYVSAVVADMNAKKPGTGDKWQQDWTDNPSALYHPAFIKKFNKEAGKIITLDSLDSKYTILAKVQVMNPGAFKFGVRKFENQIAYIMYAFSIIETANPTTIICEMEPMVATGKGGIDVHGNYDAGFTVGIRVTEVFESAGEQLGKCFIKNLK